MEELIKGKTYYIEDIPSNFFMIGLVENPNNGDNKGSLRGTATYITKGNEFRLKSVWAYYEEGSRTYRLANSEEKFWLMECIKANKFIGKDMIDFSNLIPTYEIY